MGVGLAVGDDGLVAAVAESLQCLLQLLGLRPAEVAATQMEVKGVDPLVGGGILNGTEQLCQAGAGVAAEKGHEFVGLVFRNGSCNVQLHSEIVADNGRAAVGAAADQR